MFSPMNIQAVTHFRRNRYDRFTSTCFDLFDRHALIDNCVVNQGDISAVIRRIHNLPIPVRRKYMSVQVSMAKVIFTHRHPAIPTQITLIIKITDI